MPHTKPGRPTVLAVGLFVPGTGFTRVFETLFSLLSGQFDIHWMGIGHRSEGFTTTHYTLHPVNREGGDIFGAYGAAALAEKLGASTIWLLNDFYLLKNYEYVWPALKEKNIRLIAYVPLDGYFNNTNLVPDCLFLDDMVLYAGWALAELKKNINSYCAENTPASLPRFHCIYHGVDGNHFSKTDPATARQLRRELFNKPDAADAVMLLNANRFNERKDIETTLKAFRIALPFFRHPAYCCLHMPATNPLKKNELDVMIHSLHLEQQVIYNPLGDDYVSNEQLARLYQACQVGINTSLGEGWGLVSFEHAACGGAQLVPDHTTPGELWKQAGILIPSEEAVQLSTSPFRMYKTDAEVLAEAMVELVNDENYRERVSENCYRLSRDEKFNWEHIARQWASVLMGK